MRYENYVHQVSFSFGAGCLGSGGYCQCYVQLAMAKDPEGAFFKRLEGLQPCEVSELKPGTHIFAVYGLNNLSYIVLLPVQAIFM